MERGREHQLDIGVFLTRGSDFRSPRTATPSDIIDLDYFSLAEHSGGSAPAPGGGPSKMALPTSIFSVSLGWLAPHTGLGSDSLIAADLLMDNGFSCRAIPLAH
jgi:hypothetical protein